MSRYPLIRNARDRFSADATCRRIAAVVPAMVPAVLLACLLVCIATTSCANAVGGTEDDVALIQEAVCSNTPPPPLADLSRPHPQAGKIPYRFQGTLGPQMDAIADAMAKWENLTGVVHFVEEPDNPLAHVIELDVDPTDPNKACQQFYLPPRCDDKAVHEIGHLIGLAHEHQRMDQERFITLVPLDDTCDDFGEATKYIDTIWSGTNYGPYNMTSAMHYPPNPGAQTPPNSGIPADGTFDFEPRVPGTPVGWQTTPHPTLGIDVIDITPGDVSAVQESQARHYGWDRFRNRGTDAGPGQLVTQMASGVTLQPGRDIAAARIKRIDLVIAFGSDDDAYMSTHGTESSGWREVYSSGFAVAATTVGEQFARARLRTTSVRVRYSTNATQLAEAHPEGGDAFNNGLRWTSERSFGRPNRSRPETVALASRDPSHLAVFMRNRDNELWMRHTTNLSGVTGSWIQIDSNTTGRPAAVAYNGRLRVFYPKVSGSVTRLLHRSCSTTSCDADPSVVAYIEDGTSAAASASETEIHLLITSRLGRLESRRYDVDDDFWPIGGMVVGTPAATNRFEDRFGGFGLFAESTDGNLWQRVYNRWFRGRLANLPINDFDRDGKTDLVIVRDGTWWVDPSSGLPHASFAFGQPGDIFLPAANYDGDLQNVSDMALYRRYGDFRGWNFNAMDRDQGGVSGDPITIESQYNVGPIDFGAATDRFVPGDYDGDWITDEAVFRPDEGTWYAYWATWPHMVIPFGAATDRQVPADYDGDGKTDPAVFRPSEGKWYVRPSTGVDDMEAEFGSATSRLVPGDYDGDGRADFAYVDPGSPNTWNVMLSTGEPWPVVQIGEATDRLVPGDYDGDGRTDPAVFRPSDGTWIIRLSSTGVEITPPPQFGEATDVLPWPEYTKAADTAINDFDRDKKTDPVIVRDGTWWVDPSSGLDHSPFTFGQPGDVFLPAADYSGDGGDDIVLYRRHGVSTGWNYLRVRRDTGVNRVVQDGSPWNVEYGEATDRFVPGDYDGDWITDEAIYRPDERTWWAWLSSGGEMEEEFGLPTDRRVPADYDGDGRTDPAVFRPSNGTWYVRPSGGGNDMVAEFGSGTSRLVPADYDGDRRADFAYVDPGSPNLWNVMLSGGEPWSVVQIGEATDRLVPGDYDGDGRTDPAVFRSSDGTWTIRLSSTGDEMTQQFGKATDVLPWPDYTKAANTAINDIDGDRKTDNIIVRSNVWWVRPSFNVNNHLSATLATPSDEPLPAVNFYGDAVLEIAAFRRDYATNVLSWIFASLDRDQNIGPMQNTDFGEATDIPVPGDYDGDSLIDEAVFRPSNGTWYATLSNGGDDMETPFGTATDRPVPGDYDGDGRNDVAVFRPSEATWYVRPSGGGSDYVQQWGSSDDRLVPGDYDGDRRTDYAVYTPSTGEWSLYYIRDGSNCDSCGAVVEQSEWTDMPVVGDYDGDGRADMAVFRRDGTWHVDGNLPVVSFGQSTDRVPWRTW